MSEVELVSSRALNLGGLAPGSMCYPSAVSQMTGKRGHESVKPWIMSVSLSQRFQSESLQFDVYFKIERGKDTVLVSLNSGESE